MEHNLGMDDRTTIWDVTRLRVMRTGHIIPRTKKYVTANPISADYLTNEVIKGNKQQRDNMLNELIDKFAKRNTNEQINKMEMETKDTEP